MTADRAWRGLILAGGKGIRARPYSLVVPKALFPFNDRTLIEGILDQLNEAGIRDVTIALGHMAAHVEGYLRHVRPLCGLTYQVEPEPLGTAGAIGMLQNRQQPLIAYNCDIVTDLDLAALMRFHGRTGAAITIAGVMIEHQLPFGMLERSGDGWLRSWHEKPTSHHWMSAGIYALSPGICSLVGPREQLDMNEVVERAQSNGLKIAVFEHNGYWLDVGSSEVYLKEYSDRSSA